MFSWHFEGCDYGVAGQESEVCFTNLCFAAYTVIFTKDPADLQIMLGHVAGLFFQQQGLNFESQRRSGRRRGEFAIISNWTSRVRR